MKQSFKMQHAGTARKTKLARLFSSRELGHRFHCLPTEVESALKERGLSYHKNSGGLLWELCVQP